MADEAKLGTRWQPAELDEIVADYFAMLGAELSGQPYSKSAHSKVLMTRIGRTHRSVEFKHQNISAVLDELGLPWIRGYIPKRNQGGGRRCRLRCAVLRRIQPAASYRGEDNERLCPDAVLS